MITQLEIEEKWHYKRVLCKTGEYPDKEYYVTACLIKDTHVTMAIMALDYKGSGEGWYTFHICLDCIDKLDDMFQILGDYNNIIQELFCFVVQEHHQDEKDGFLCRVIDACKQGGEEDIYFWPKDYFKGDVQATNLYYRITWKSTAEGKLLATSHILIKEDFDNLSLMELWNLFKPYRGCALCGMYHHVDMQGNPLK